MRIIPSVQRVDPALAVLRLGVGVVFLAHGYQKLFGMGFAGVTEAFTQMGVPIPGVAGPMIACLEFFGGIALIFGLLTNVVAFLFVCDMLGVLLLVKRGAGLTGRGGMELEFLLMFGALTLVLAGAGAFSVDAVLDRRAPITRRT